MSFPMSFPLNFYTKNYLPSPTTSGTSAECPAAEWKPRPRDHKKEAEAKRIGEEAFLRIKSRKRR